MYLFKFFCVFLTVALLSVLSNAWQIKPDDSSFWKNEVVRISDNKLQEWKTASAAGDNTQMYNLLQELYDTVKQAEDNNSKKGPIFNRVISRMKTLSDKSDLDNCLGSGGRFRLLLAAIDGNKDNKSYYSYEAGMEWIEKRLPFTNGQMYNELKEIQEVLTRAHESINDFGYTFGSGAKKLAKLLENKQGKKNENEIRRIVNGIVAKQATATHINDTSLALQKIEVLKRNILPSSGYQNNANYGNGLGNSIYGYNPYYGSSGPQNGNAFVGGFNPFLLPQQGGYPTQQQQYNPYYPQQNSQFQGQPSTPYGNQFGYL
jgi:hypothetical protein